MRHPQITIHLGANINTVTVDGHTFDRYRMSRHDQNRLRRMIVEAYRKINVLKGRQQ